MPVVFGLGLRQYAAYFVYPFRFEQHPVEIGDSLDLYILLQQRDLPPNVLLPFGVIAVEILLAGAIVGELFLYPFGGFLFLLQQRLDHIYDFFASAGEQLELASDQFLQFLQLADEVGGIFQLLAFGLLDQFGKYLGLILLNLIDFGETALQLLLELLQLTLVSALLLGK